MTNVNFHEVVDVEQLIAIFCGTGRCDNFDGDPVCPSTQGDVLARQHHAVERGLCPSARVKGETGVMVANADGVGSFIVDKKS